MTTQLWNGLRRVKVSGRGFQNIRYIAVDSRNRLSNFWTPTTSISLQDGEQGHSHDLLIRGGFLRKAHSGVFHLLPLGLRVQDKLCILIDKHMASLGASKVSLSSITTEALWRQSGRYSTNSELLRLSDRKDSGFLLSPTHEEEITSLVAGMVHSYKDLPLRLYQIGRKYRDERRPRQGLLRAKEFLMKDLYTFDYSEEHALETYKEVRQAYNNLFDELKLPYLVANADSGNMGGKLSHEYHFVSPNGEDNVWSCNTCDYVANEELAEARASEPRQEGQEIIFTGISVDRTTKVEIHVLLNEANNSSATDWSQIHHFVNLHAVKRAGIDIDTGIEASTLSSLLPQTTQTFRIHDQRLPPPRDSTTPSLFASTQTLNLAPLTPNSPCPNCSSGHLSVQKAVEVAHTFHLGTRYSLPLNALVAVPTSNAKQAIYMGCHGIGVSRLIGAIASLLADDHGLNWPRAVAPFECIVVTAPQTIDGEAEQVYDVVQGRWVGGAAVDTVLDDRKVGLGWKMKDADLIGYPVVVVLGRAWKERQMVEVQCRRLGVKREVKLEVLKTEVERLLDQL